MASSSVSISLPLLRPGRSHRNHHRYYSSPFKTTTTTTRALPLLKTSAELSRRTPVDEGREELQQQQSSGSSTITTASSLLVQQNEHTGSVEEWVGVLKDAAKTRRVPAGQILAALDAIKKAKLDPSSFLDTLGGSASPGRTWMLVFTAQGRLERGGYFPLTAVQRFDAVAKRIENGVYLGPLGCLTFEGRFSWKTRKLAFIFEFMRIKVGPFGPLQINLGKEEDREPDTKDPFFIWFYVDEEIAVAQGRGGGTAFWCRCRRDP